MCSLRAFRRVASLRAYSTQTMARATRKQAILGEDGVHETEKPKGCGVESGRCSQRAGHQRHGRAGGGDERGGWHANELQLLEGKLDLRNTVRVRHGMSSDRQKNGREKRRQETKSCSHPLHRAQLAGRLDSTAVGNVPEQGVAGQQPLACVHAKAALREGKWSEGIPQQNRGKP